MRAHVPKNRRQHETFLAEAPVGSPEARDALSFIASLPVFLDLGGLRLAHAAWSEAAVMAIRARRPDGLLSKADLQRLALEDESDPFTAAVLAMVKGPEATLPPGYAFHDHKGERRTEIRLRWWAAEAATWRDVAASVPDLSELPDGPFDDAAAPDPGPVPVAFGHHKRSGPVEIDAARALCLDYPETPIAYRWDGETAFDPSRLVFA